MRTLYTSGSPWEPKMGYSRAVQVGGSLFISATAATGPDGNVVSDDLYEQTKNILEKLDAVLQNAGFTLAEVVSSRMAVSDWDNWAEAARAHGEVFGEIRPAFTLSHVLPFVDPAMLVEIDIVAMHDPQS